MRWVRWVTSHVVASEGTCSRVTVAPMDLSTYRIRESVVVTAPAEEVWERVQDITRMGEASPNTTGCEWDDPSVGMADGAWFTGTNRAGENTYSTRCAIASLEPGRSFAFVNFGLDGSSPSSRWGYEVDQVEGATELTETWELMPEFIENITTNYPDVDVDQLADERKATMHKGIIATLEALKAGLER